MRYLVLSILFIANAELKAQESYTKVYEEGFQKGYQDGYQQALEDSQEEFERLKRVYNDVLNQQLEKMDQSYQKEFSKQIEQMRLQFQKGTPPPIQNTMTSPYRDELIQQLWDKPNEKLIKELVSELQNKSRRQIEQTLLESLSEQSWVYQKIAAGGFSKNFIIELLRDQQSLLSVLEARADDQRKIIFFLINLILFFAFFIYLKKFIADDQPQIEIDRQKKRARLTQLTLHLVVFIYFYGSSLKALLTMGWRSL